MNPSAPEGPCIDAGTARALVRGELAAPARFAAEEHLRTCRVCTALVQHLCDAETGAGPTGSSRTGEVTEADRPSLRPGPAPTVEQQVLPPPEAKAPLQAGSRIGRYLLLACIGEGGQGQVFAAWDPQLERKVAIKLLRQEPWEDAEEAALAQARLLREAQAMAQLSHPNVVAVHDVGTCSEGVFLAMEFVEGGDVRDWLKARKRTAREVLAVFLAAGRGLSAAHAAGIVHRDIKPANILMGRDGVARLTDFGIARAEHRDAGEATTRSHGTGSASLAQTVAGSMVGTPAYMAPEQLGGEPATARSDQFSFAVSLWLACYGHRPFEGRDPDALREAALAMRLVPDPPEAKVPARVRAALLRALSPKPEDRFPSIDALLDALARDPWARRRRVALGVVALLAVLLGAGALVRARVENQRLCRGSQQRLAGVWDSPRREAARRALVATGHPGAETAWAALHPLLDAYAAQWAQLGDAACEAALLRGTETRRVFGLRSVCLEERLSELHALVGLLERADVSLVGRAPQLAGALTPLSGCADVAALERGLALPDDPARREQLRGLEEQLHRLKLLREAARFGEAEAALGPLRQGAEALGYRPLQARVELQAGLLAEERSDIKGAERTLFAAVVRAQAGGDRATLAAAASRLMYVLGQAQERFDEGLGWGELAGAAIESMGGADPALEADVHSNRGAVYLRMTRWEDALRESQRGVELRRRAFGEKHYLLARSLNNTGVALGGLGRTGEALQALGEAAALAREVLGPDHPHLLLYRTNQANTLMSKGRFAEAEEVLRDVVARARASRWGPSIGTPRSRWKGWPTPGSSSGASGRRSPTRRRPTASSSSSPLKALRPLRRDV